MQVKNTSKRQYARLVDRAADQLNGTLVPPEGWLATMRKAIGMSGPQLAKRNNVTKAAIYQAERKELEGAISIKQLQKLATSMDSKLIYAIVPNKPINELVSNQARLKANAIVQQASTHMGLEKQSLSKSHDQEEVNRIADELARAMPTDLWDKI